MTHNTNKEIEGAILGGSAAPSKKAKIDVFGQSQGIQKWYLVTSVTSDRDCDIRFVEKKIKSH
jgi:hypothetical protein